MRGIVRFALAAFAGAATGIAVGAAQIRLPGATTPPVACTIPAGNGPRVPIFEPDECRRRGRPTYRHSLRQP